MISIHQNAGSITFSLSYIFSEAKCEELERIMTVLIDF